uniref:Uncharacterized protein n=1 Tax=Manihot esculenta TaxID=3983 RepID=A0A2C9VV91_MANES
MVEDLITNRHLRKPMLLSSISSWLAMMPTLLTLPLFDLGVMILS